MWEIYKNRNDGKLKKRECNKRTSQEVTHPSTTLAQARLTSELRSSDGIRCFSAGMIASDILAPILPLIPVPRRAEATRGPRPGPSQMFCRLASCSATPLVSNTRMARCAENIHDGLRIETAEIEKKGMQHEDFPGGHPS